MNYVIFILTYIFLLCQGFQVKENPRRFIGDSEDEVCNCGWKSYDGTPPWVVSTKIDGKHYGWGALMSPWHVLLPLKTKSERIENPSEVTIQVDVSDKARKVQRIEYHSQEKLALLLLKQPTKMKSKVICTWQSGWANQEFPKELPLVSFGDKETRTKNKDGKLMPRYQCQQIVEVDLKRDLRQNEFCVSLKGAKNKDQTSAMIYKRLDEETNLLGIAMESIFNSDKKENVFVALNVTTDIGDWIYSFDFSCGKCPFCSLYDKLLICEEKRLISVFPDDVNTACPKIVENDLQSIKMDYQNIEVLDFAQLAKFSPNVTSIQFKHNKISKLVGRSLKGKLRHLEKVRLYVNGIQKVEDGFFDQFPQLTLLDLRSNPIKKLVTNSWSFCHRITSKLLVVKGVRVESENSPNTDQQEFCQIHTGKGLELLKQCQPINDNSTVDCSKHQTHNFEVALLGCCKILPKLYPTIILSFPQDNERKHESIEDFSTCEKSPMVKEITQVLTTMNKLMTDVELYAIALDLSTLNDKLVDPKRIKNVTIWADSVYTSKTININYHLTIRARVVKIDHDIKMSVPSQDFKDDATYRVPYERHIRFTNGLLMRQRKFGTIDILDVLPKKRKGTSNLCRPRLFASNEIKDAQNWFDKTHTNLLFTCAMDMKDTNPKVAQTMARSILDLYSDKSLVNDPLKYLNAQRMVRVNKSVHDTYHRVPSFALSRVQRLATFLSNRFESHKDDENRMKDTLKRTNERLFEVDMKFFELETQYEEFFQQEQRMIEAIEEGKDSVVSEIRDSTDLVVEKQDANAKVILENTWKGTEKEMEAMKSITEKMDQHVDHQKTRLKSTLKLKEKHLSKSQESLKTKFNDLEGDIETFSSNFKKWEEEFKSSAPNLKNERYCLPNFIKTMEDNFNGRISLPKKNINGISFFDKFKWDLTAITNSAKLMHKEPIDVTKDVSNINGDLSEALKRVDSIDSLDKNVKKVKKMVIDSIVWVKQGFEKYPNLDDIEAQIEIITDNLGQLVDEGKRMAVLFSDYLELKLAEEEATLNKEDSQALVQEMSTHIEDVKSLSISGLKQLQDQRDEYIKARDKLRQTNDKVSSDNFASLKSKTNEKYDDLKNALREFKAKATRTVSLSADSVSKKKKRLIELALEDRKLAMFLFRDYCDALFFRTYKKCDNTIAPTNKDGFNEILRKLNLALTDLTKSGGDILGGHKPTIIDNEVRVTDIKPYTVPIKCLLRNKMALVNLKEFVPKKVWKRSPRLRLSSLVVEYLDKDDQTLKSKGQTLGDEVITAITFPAVYKELATDGNTYTFKTNYDFTCTSSYTVKGIIHYSLLIRNFKPYTYWDFQEKV